jgi:hypothetical protein
MPRSPERTVSPTVYGIEDEYSCLITFPGNKSYELVGSCHSVDSELGLYQQPSGKGTSVISEALLEEALGSMGITRNIYGMLSNGGRLYMDPSGPEYDKPETTTAQEAVLRSFDGDTIMVKIFDHLMKKEVITGYQMNRKIVDHNRTSRGIHLNTTTKLSNATPSDRVAETFATLNVAKGAVFGSGGLLLDEEGNTDYHHSPRLSLTTEVAAHYGQYTLRPLVRTPFKDDGERLKRIETVTSDALNFGWPLRASLVATNALAKVIELGYGDKLPRLRDAVAAAHTVGRYGSESTVTVVGKRGVDMEVTPLDVLRDYCEVMLGVDVIEGQLDGESKQVIPEIIDVADRMAADPYSVATQVESMARLVAMEQKMDKNNLRLDSERMCRFDYAWDWITGMDRGIAEKLRNKGMVGWQGFDPLVKPAVARKRLSTPPSDTRAGLRGELISHNPHGNNSTWEMIDFGDEEGIRYVHPLGYADAGEAA